MDSQQAVAAPQDDYVIEPPAKQGASASSAGGDYQIEIPHDSQQQGPINPYASNPLAHLPAQAGDSFAPPAYLKSFTKPQAPSPGDTAVGSANTNLRLVPAAAPRVAPANAQEQLDQKAA